MVQDLQLSQTEADILHTAPCPPSWDMSLLFSFTICLDCEQRIQLLYKCLKEWNITIDCENILNCDDCISCDICGTGSDTDNKEIALNETTWENDKIEKNENFTVEVEVEVVTVSVILSVTAVTVCTVTVFIVCKKRRKQSRLKLRQPNKRDRILNKETKITLVKDEKEDEIEKMNVSDKLLNENIQTCSKEKIT
ncbi:uncharacterized protein LOC127738069 [Mytilus californianus]|uniref:uncharacterized protein LOC127738069 n=1 Tax=Mytilus californianus TaxID=6549 RepID=UPI002246032A|nr:uncharacterized protein LOC127738069 [Mytilus californianus]